MIPFAFVGGVNRKKSSFRILCHNGTGYFWKTSLDGGATWTDSSLVVTGNNTLNLTAGKNFNGTYIMPVGTSGEVTTSIAFSSVWNSGYSSQSRVAGAAITYGNGFKDTVLPSGTNMYFPVVTLDEYGVFLSRMSYNNTAITNLAVAVMGSRIIRYGSNIFLLSALAATSGNLSLLRMTSSPSTFSSVIPVVSAGGGGRVVKKGRIDNQIVTSRRVSTGIYTIVEINNMNTNTPSLGTIYGSMPAMPADYGECVYDIHWSSKFNKYLIAYSNDMNRIAVVDSTAMGTDRLSVTTPTFSTYFYYSGTASFSEDSEGNVYLSFSAPRHNYHRIYKTTNGTSWTQVFTNLSSTLKVHYMETFIDT